VKVIILAAGKGTRMGQVDNNLNKALLPIKNKAVISHIIDFFPTDSEFVVSVGHKSQQVIDYLTTAHSEKKITFVHVDNIDGPGSGPGYSLLCCKNELQEPFFYIPCDALLYGDLKSTPKGNWVGTKQVDPNLSVNYCNFLVKDGIVTSIKDKEKCNENFLAWSGLVYVYDYKDFWKNLSNPTVIAGEHQISNGLNGLIDSSGLLAVEVNWIDLGDAEKYYTEKKKENKYDFSKIDEAIYFVNNKVIKFFADKKIVDNRIKKANLKPHVFPKISRHGENFYSYQYATGKILYESSTPKIFNNFLNWLNEYLWSDTEVHSDKMKNLCHDFYYSKTLKRIKLFKEKNPNYLFPKFVNGVELLDLDTILKKIPWERLCDGKPTFIHGDLNFDNVLYDDSQKKFLLIDWRQDFAGELEFGDIYYDLAKIYGGILLNYDCIKQGLFHHVLEKNDVFFDFARRISYDLYIPIFENFVKNQNLDMKKIKIINALSYLNMAPLHNPPYDKILISFGLMLLSTELEDI